MLLAEHCVGVTAEAGRGLAEAGRGLAEVWLRRQVMALLRCDWGGRSRPWVGVPSICSFEPCFQFSPSFAVFGCLLPCFYRFHSEVLTLHSTLYFLWRNSTCMCVSYICARVCSCLSTTANYINRCLVLSRWTINAFIFWDWLLRETEHMRRPVAHSMIVAHEVYIIIALY